MSGKIFQRGDSFYFRIPVRHQDGRYGTLWRGGFLNAVEAEAAKKRAEQIRDTGHDLDAATLTVGGWLERWLDMRSTDLGKRTLKGYQQLVRDNITPRIGRILLADLRRREILMMLSGIAKTGHHRTAFNTHHVLRTALKAAVMMELIPSNPTDGLAAPKVPHADPKLPTIEELRTLLSVLDAHRLGGLIRLALATGLRQGELVDLRWDSIDLGRATLHVRQAKHGSIGTIRLLRWSVADLTKHRLAQKDHADALKGAWPDEGWVFANALGGRLTTGQVRHAWTDIRKAAGIEARFHDLRHMHASLLLMLGAPPKLVQTRLRHKHASTTLAVYAHLLPDADIEAPELAALDEFLEALT